MGHHVVPQRYLKGFQAKAKPGYIWMYDKKDGTPKLLPIKQVAQVPGFYAADVEASLNTEVEIPGNDVIDKLRAGGTLEEIDRKHLTYYIATMIARVPAARAKINKIVPEVLAGLASDVKRAIEEAARLGLIDEQTKLSRLAEAEKVTQRFEKQPPPEVTKVIETPWPFESWLLTIHSMTWRILTSNGPSYFLTSANPATLLDDEGLGTRGCELTFPLSTEMMLHCSWHGGREFESRAAWPAFVKECNRRTAFQAQRFVFYHEDAPWVLELARNEFPKLNRINWG